MELDGFMERLTVYEAIGLAMFYHQLVKPNQEKYEGKLLTNPELISVQSE
jgi:hypothetical protein